MDDISYAYISEKSSELLEDNHSVYNPVAAIRKMSLLGNIKSRLSKRGIARGETKSIINSIKEEITLTQRISRLKQMQEIFKYWHVAHLPFALIMLIIVIVHVVVTLAFGYKWIF